LLVVAVAATGKLLLRTVAVAALAVTVHLLVEKTVVVLFLLNIKQR
jgi:hypothetical protein